VHSNQIKNQRRFDIADIQLAKKKKKQKQKTPI
jgi:hypothetical protein